jgi:AcrR family transcriptional regulator
VADTVRSDAARNRQTITEVATRLFATATPGEEPSMRLIAREADVGVGTLFRHFPSREALVEAVYSDQVRRLTDGADELLGAHPPARALRRWMDLFADWMATKNGMLDTLLAMINNEQLGHTDTHDQLLAAIDKILAAGRANGDIRDDATAADIAAGIIGLCTAAHGGQAGRLLDIFMNGLATSDD